MLTSVTTGSARAAHLRQHRGSSTRCARTPCASRGRIPSGSLEVSGTGVIIIPPRLDSARRLAALPPIRVRSAALAEGVRQSWLSRTRSSREGSLPLTRSGHSVDQRGRSPPPPRADPRARIGLAQGLEKWPIFRPCGAQPRGSGGAPPTNLILLRNQRSSPRARASPPRWPPGWGRGGRGAGGGRWGVGVGVGVR